jgi:hypothetical protein
MKLPKPPSNNHHISESHRLVRERSFTPKSSIETIIEILKESHATGQLMIDMNQGGIGSIRFREEQKVNFEEST